MKLSNTSFDTEIINTVIGQWDKSKKTELIRLIDSYWEMHELDEKARKKGLNPQYKDLEEDYKLESQLEAIETCHIIDKNNYANLNTSLGNFLVKKDSQLAKELMKEDPRLFSLIQGSSMNKSHLQGSCCLAVEKLDPNSKLSLKQLSEFLANPKAISDKISSINYGQASEYTDKIGEKVAEKINDIEFKGTGIKPEQDIHTKFGRIQKKKGEPSIPTLFRCIPNEWIL